MKERIRGEQGEVNEGAYGCGLGCSCIQEKKQNMFYCTYESKFFAVIGLIQ